MPVVVDQVEIVPESVRGSADSQPRPETGSSSRSSTEDILSVLERARERDLRRSPR